MTDYKQLMTDYKQLCAELLSELENAIRVIYGEDGTRHISSADPVIAKADAALAEPDPEGPTDQELLRLYKVATPCHAVEEYTRELDFARAVLARWGRPAPVPVPVSEHPDEREGWCDSDGRCWWGRRADSTSNADWFYATWAETIVFCEHSMPQFSLPHDALPLPAGEAQPVPVSERLPGVLCRRRT